MATWDAEGMASTALFDVESGLVSEALFRYLVQQRVTAARERLGQLWVAVVEPHAIDDAPRCPALVGDVLVDALTDAVVVARLDDGRYAVLIDGLKEREALSMLSAVPAASAAPWPDVVMHVGMAAYPQHGFDVGELLDEAATALVEAQTWPIARIEVATLPA